MPSSTDYHSVPTNEEDFHLDEQKRRKSRSILATVMLAICIFSFVLQTEVAQYVQQTTNYQKPYLILYIGHSCYLFMIPFQFIAECIGRWPSKPTTFLSHVKDTATHCTKELVQSFGEIETRMHGSARNSNKAWFAIRTSTWLALLITIPAYLWYVSVNLTTMSNLTAIYNTACVFAYVFSILMLNDRLVPFKIGAVMMCMTGVFIMAYWTPEHLSDDDSLDKQIYSPYGILVAVFGAGAYGFYEVYYKKYATPSRPSILFANTVTGIIGCVTLLLLWIPLPLLHLSGYEVFEMPDKETFWCIMGISAMSVVYNATFMCVIALVNPVFAAVGVMLTVPAVAVTDVLVTGVMVTTNTIVGSVFILIGFLILSREIDHKQIS
ncbi:hypothetical protein DFQ28_009477 [Apophysomyces sp. BC1034]|nr:hypothetical protein DFQ30_009181 [Apophysomyces sp. BC1015]KAG0172892.1 hypothetical protein DFQ29_008201 [Apophysomyces sp. BC1021]KAG0185361.1 hypothetical protein DFQ28_009477 [Apophysomyces sp. BC1034]